MTKATNPHVAVVVLNWNGIHHLQTYLPSVVTNTPDEVDLWVADNGSTDESVSWLREAYPDRVKVLELHENYGFAEGYNRALETVRAELYVLLNSDVRVSGGWLWPVVETMNDAGWDVASPRIVQDADPTRCEHAGAAGGWMDRDGFPFCLGRMFGDVEVVDDWHRRDREVFWASGACFFIRASTWQRLGGFDGSLFAHMEEIDLCWRVKNDGGRVGCVGTAEVRHLGGGTLQTASPFKTYLNFRNNLIVMLKNRDGFWPAFMFRRMTLDGIAAWRFLLGGDVRNFLAVGKAHFAFYSRLGSTLRMRRRLRKSARRRPNTTGWWSGSVLWAHFIRGKKKARDLQLPEVA